MTEEQIKQNAEEYAKERCIRYNEQYGACYDAYIAGAHRRDIEVMNLEHLLKVERTSNKVLVEANNKLRYPWVSVKVRLPEIDQTQHTKKKNLSIAVLAHDIDMLHDALGQAYSPSVVRYDYERKDWLYVELGCYANEVEIGAEITHWMPIPELKKGE